MSIASEITRISGNIADAYTACNGKGATMPSSASQNSDNLATCINSIQTGGGGVGIPREVSQSGVYQMPTTSFTWALPSNATDVGDYALYYAFRGCPNLTSVDLSSLTTISSEGGLSYTFQNCTGLTGNLSLLNLTNISGMYGMRGAFYNTGLTSVNLSNLMSISNTSGMASAFNKCTSLTSVDLSGLTTITGTGALLDAFSGCTSLTSINFTNLTTIGNNSSSSNVSHFSNAFNNCTSLTTLSFPELTAIYCTGTNTNTQGTFYGNNQIQKFYFPKLTTITYGTGASSTNQVACKLIFAGCSALTEIHFGAANESAIKATSGWSTLWGRGAGNATVYFDL